MERQSSTARAKAEASDPAVALDLPKPRPSLDDLYAVERDPEDVDFVSDVVDWESI